MDRLINYLKATKAELVHVSWPSRRQAIVTTLLVVGVSLLAAVFLGFFDYLFSDLIMDWIISR